MRKSGDHLRVTAQLINSRDGTHLLSQTYDRDLSDVLKMQDEIAAALVRVLQIEVSDEVIGSRPAVAQYGSLHFVSARAACQRSVRPAGYRAGRQRLSAGARSRPVVCSGRSGARQRVLRSRAVRIYAAERRVSRRPAPRQSLALKLDPKLAATHALLGNIYIAYDWDWAAAEREFRLALAGAPNDAYVLFIAAVQAQIMGRWDDALKLINASLAQDPLNPSSYLVLNYIQIRRGRLAEAEAAIRRTLEISPTFASAHYGLGLVLLARGDPQAALTEMLKEGDDGARLGGLRDRLFRTWP